ncbi:hypothetical protein ACFL2M_02050 [Patescibacteria group bacterium]
MRLSNLFGYVISVLLLCWSTSAAAQHRASRHDKGAIEVHVPQDFPFTQTYIFEGNGCPTEITGETSYVYGGQFMPDSRFEVLPGTYTVCTYAENGGRVLTLPFAIKTLEVKRPGHTVAYELDHRLHARSTQRANGALLLSSDFVWTALDPAGSRGVHWSGSVGVYLEKYPSGLHGSLESSLLLGGNTSGGDLTLRVGQWLPRSSNIRFGAHGGTSLGRNKFLVGCTPEPSGDEVLVTCDIPTSEDAQLFKGNAWMAGALGGVALNLEQRTSFIIEFGVQAPLTSINLGESIAIEVDPEYRSRTMRLQFDDQRPYVWTAAFRTVLFFF